RFRRAGNPAARLRPEHLPRGRRGPVRDPLRRPARGVRSGPVGEGIEVMHAAATACGLASPSPGRKRQRRHTICKFSLHGRQPLRPPHGGAGHPPAVPGGKVVAVLIVDDCEVTRKALQSLLESRGYRDVICAVSGEEALRLLTAADAPTVEVVLMDVEMAGMDGIETCRRLKAIKHLHDIPVLIVTGNSQEQAL